MNFSLSPMTRGDVTEVAQIEKDSFHEEVAYDRKQFRQAINHQSVTAQTLRIHDKGVSYIAGYIVWEMYEKHFDLISMAVDKIYRGDNRDQRYGLGTYMVAKLKSKLCETRSSLYCSVQETNLPAQLFFRANGFRCVEIMPGFFPGEDGWLFAFDLHPNKIEDFQWRRKQTQKS